MEKKMTFDEWANKRIFQQDLHQVNDTMPNTSGFIYPDGSCIYIKHGYFCVDVGSESFQSQYIKETEKHLWDIWSALSYRTEGNDMKTLNDFAKAHLEANKETIITDYIDYIVSPMMKDIRGAVEKYDLGPIVMDAFEEYDWEQNTDVDNDFDEILDSI